MKNFSGFIKDDNSPMLTYSAFLISRANMPQVHVPSFVAFMDRLNVPYNKYVGDVQNFRPTQTDFDKHKVANISMEIRKNTNFAKSMTAILVSEEGFVIDGHHRFYAAQREEVDINIIMINLPINKALKLAMDFVEYEKSGE